MMNDSHDGPDSGSRTYDPQFLDSKSNSPLDAVTNLDNNGPIGWMQLIKLTTPLRTGLESPPLKAALAAIYDRLYRRAWRPWTNTFWQPGNTGALDCQDWAGGTALHIVSGSTGHLHLCWLLSRDYLPSFFTGDNQDVEPREQQPRASPPLTQPKHKRPKPTKLKVRALPKFKHRRR